MSFNNIKVISILEASKMLNVTRQAIYQAIRNKRVNAIKDGIKWAIDLNSLFEYKKSKYSRQFSKCNGEVIFDKNRGLMSCVDASRHCRVPAQNIYYAIRRGMLKASKKGCAWVINKADVDVYKKLLDSKEA